MAGFIGLVHLPHDSAGANILAFVLAVEHRPAGHHDGRNITAGRAHQQRRRGLVATGQQHHGIDRVTANGFFHIHARQVAREHGRGAQVGFTAGKHWELHREAACFQHAFLDVLGDLAEMRIARGQLRPGVADADNRFALELVVRNALVLHPAAVHEPVLVGGSEPLGGAQ